MADGDNQYKKFKGFKILRGDESNPTFGILVDDASEALHICDPDDQNTDWAVSAYSHPTLVVHSATTPATDYVSIDHDATDATINVASGNLKVAFDGTDELTLTTAALSPSTSDGSTLGTSTLLWSDLYLASGAILDWATSDITLTHTAGLLTLLGGGLTIGESGSGAGDIILWPNGASAKVWLDIDADTNGAFYFGANDYGIDVGFYGQTISESMLWDASANALVFTAGGITMGATSDFIMPVKASGSTTRGDMWLDTTDGYIHFYDTVERIVTTTAA